MRGRAADASVASFRLHSSALPRVMALVTVLVSVMNGFERELQNNILGLMPQAILLLNTVL